MKRWIQALAVVGCVFLAGALAARAENWPSWRGPNQAGVSQETKLPATWSPTSNIAWKVKMPKGSSTPAIWGDRMFLTIAEGKNLSLLCLTTEGKELWTRKFGTASNETFQKDETSGAAASASTDGKHVYVFSETGELVGYDFDGKELWRFNVQNTYGKFQTNWGTHTTPLLHGDRLYLSILHRVFHYVIAVDKLSGKVVWKVDRPTDAKGESNESYSTPVVWGNDKDSYLVVLGGDYVTGHRLSDGAEVWRVGDLNSKTKYTTAFRIIASPVASPDLIVVPTAANRGNDVVVGIKPAEILKAKGTVVAGSPFEQWRHKGAPDVPSPLIHGDFVYVCSEQGLLTCLDAKTGKPHYSKQRLQPDRYRASPVYADGKIYMTARGGTFSVVKAGAKFELLAENKLPDIFTASPAVSGGRIYLRGWTNLYAVQEMKK